MGAWKIQAKHRNMQSVRVFVLIYISIKIYIVLIENLDLEILFKHQNDFVLLFPLWINQFQNLRTLQACGH